MIRAYHFVGDVLRNGEPVPPDGVWLEYDGPMPIILCERGLHASVHPFDALKYVPGTILCLVDLDGDILSDTDKHVATRRIIRARVNTETTLRSFARHCAKDVLPLWNAPQVVIDYLETGQESIRAAAWAFARAAAWAAALDAERDAARAAAWAAAWDATRAAAWAAAWAATRDVAIKKYKDQFQVMVNELFLVREA